MLCYQPTADLALSADITFQNMREYYAHYSVDWDRSKIEEQIAELQNWDILLGDSIIGAIRLAFDDEGCYIRDLQVCEEFRNRGIGAKALEECERLAVEAGAKKLRLRVFKISPAHHLYSRNGFVVDSEEERFLYMSRPV